MLKTLNKFSRMSRGERLKYKRTRLGISPSYVAAQIGVTRPTYTFWEQDKIKDISYRLVVKLADVLLTTPNWIETGQPGTQFYSNDENGNRINETLSQKIESEHIEIKGMVGKSVAMDLKSEFSVNLPAASKAIYAVSLAENSAICAANTGDALIVDSDKEIVPGEEVLVIFKGLPCEVAIFGMSDNGKLHCRNESGKQIYDYNSLTAVHPIVAVARHSYLIKADKGL